MEEKKYKKTKKVTGIVLASVLFAATIVGAGFGFASGVEEFGGIDTSYNDYAQIEADVKFEDGESDIRDAAKSITNTLTFLGMQNATVRTIGDSKIVINNPITSYTSSDLNIMNNTEDHFDLMGYNSNSNYFNEIGTLLIPLFFDGTLDIRDAEGDAAFVNVSDDGGHDYQFVGGVEEGGTFGVEQETPEGSSISTTSRYDEIPFVENFFEGATLKHENGYPVIELQIAKEGNNGDGYINMFKELDRYIDSTASSENPTTYVFWFNYELTYQLVDKLDPEFDGDLYTYVTSNSNLRPLYVTANNTSIMSSKYSDTVEIKGAFTERQAKYFVNKINNSQTFTYSNIQLEVIINLQTKIMLIVLASLLLLIILVVIFSFVAYFGLLGMITSAIFVLSTMTTTLILSSTGILITGLGLVALGVTMLVTALLMLQSLNIYKNNNEDKFLSVNKVASDKLHAIHGTLFLPIVSVVLMLYVAGLLLSTALAVSLYLVVIGSVIAYLFTSVLLIPILYVLDLLLEWTRTNEESKWTFISGVNKEFTPKSNVEVKDRSKLGLIIAAIMVVVSVVMGGTLLATTGSAFNTNAYGTWNYTYLVQATNTEAWLDLQSEGEMSAPYGAEFLIDYYESTEANADKVEKAFEDSGVNVTSIETIRIDKVEEKEEELMLFGSMGYQINSNDKINSAEVDEINTTLSTIEIQLTEDVSNTAENNPKTTFEISERMSWTGTEAIKVSDYTNGSLFKDGLLALLVMIFVVGLILLFVGNWGVALASLISSFIEMVLIISPFIILFIPVSSIIVFPMVLIFVMSLRNKTIITKQAKKDEIDNGKWERAANNNKWTTPIFASMLLVLELMLFGIYNWVLVIPMLIITIVAPIVVYFIEIFVFTPLASKFDKIRNERKEAQLKRDIESANNKKDGEIKEEYIEGVNM